MLRKLLILLSLIVICFAAWVRLAPTDPARWHVLPQDAAPGNRPGGALRRIGGDTATFARLAALIADTPRTTRIAGDTASGMITFETRSRGFAFPDYTTIRLDADGITLYGRLRYGLSDLGVNAARIDGWLDALAQ